ncbi:MAG: hypothetical protein IJV33_06780 [Bacteroidaceae bacterium]|nr:hypothetical protein [Bacteroidaceae bacterium]
MRIFFLTSRYLGLEQPITDALHRQGHEVFILLDKALPSDCYQKEAVRYPSVRNFILRQYNRIGHVYERYWKKMIQRNEELNLPFDLFLCINGQSFHPYLLDHLRHLNPSIKTCIYIWDTNQYYDFARNLKYFEKRFSFDYRDCKVYDKLEYLPFYWVNQSNDTKIEYDLSLIGTDHDGRFEIVEKLYPQVKKHLKSFFIKVVIAPRPFYNRSKINRIFHFLLRPRLYQKEMNTWLYKKSQDFATTSALPHHEAERIIAQSNCVLDTDRESQCGTTPRLIWALASGKKIVTTNKNITNLPFFEENQIKIIDRFNPMVDWEFVQKREKFSISKYVENLNIDVWVKNFL